MNESPIEILLKNLIDEQRKANAILAEIAKNIAPERADQFLIDAIAAHRLGSTIPAPGDTEAVQVDNAHPGAKAKLRSRRKDG